MLSWQKIELVTTNKVASQLMDVKIFFQKNKCLTDPDHYKDSKMMIFFVYALKQQRIGTALGGMQPYYLLSI